MPTIYAAALDALEYVSLGIVKDVLKMKVLSMDDFNALNADLEKVKKDLNAATARLDVATADAGKLTDIMEKKATCDKSVTDLTQERDSLKAAADETSKKIADLETKVGGLESELATAKAAAAPAAAETTDDAETTDNAEGGRLLRRR